MKGKKSDPSDTDTADSIAAYEARWAAGFTKSGDGKHVMADGLIGKLNGYRHILPPDAGIDTDELDYWRWQNIDELVAAAKEVLHGRNASVFEGLVLDPLQGKPRKSIEFLAEQFGVPPAAFPGFCTIANAR